jgi:hypothetical protein
VLFPARPPPPPPPPPHTHTHTAPNAEFLEASVVLGSNRYSVRIALAVPIPFKHLGQSLVGASAALPSPFAAPLLQPPSPPPLQRRCVRVPASQSQDVTRLESMQRQNLLCWPCTTNQKMLCATIGCSGSHLCAIHVSNVCNVSRVNGNCRVLISLLRIVSQRFLTIFTTRIALHDGQKYIFDRPSACPPPPPPSALERHVPRRVGDPRNTRQCATPMRRPECARERLQRHSWPGKV